MTELNGAESWRLGVAGRLAMPLRSMLLENRQRWRDLVFLAGELVFETDERGCFTFIAPDPALGWRAEALLGRSASVLLATGRTGEADPFRPQSRPRRQRVWLRRGDGDITCVVLSVAPLTDRLGRLSGARGLVTDITGQEAGEARTIGRLRRCEAIEHVLSCIRQEVLPPRTMKAVLSGLTEVLEAEGAAVVGMEGNQTAILRETGEGAPAILPAVQELMRASDPQSGAMTGHADGRPLLVSTCLSAFGGLSGLALWRTAGGRAWDADDGRIAANAVSLIRVVLDHEAIQRDMARQARTDPLTGLPNRRAFLEELPRHIDRLDRETAPGTLMSLDLDHFKSVNERFGHELGDQLMCCLAEMLRNAVRPTDLVARLGGDKFAIWLNGADHLTAAERAERLRVDVPRRFGELAPGLGSLGVSIGIATRQPGSGEAIEDLMRRGEQAMAEVKRSGRGHWRVSLAEPG